jgi:hypothetical protein
VHVLKIIFQCTFILKENNKLKFDSQLKSLTMKYSTQTNKHNKDSLKQYKVKIVNIHSTTTKSCLK